MNSTKTLAKMVKKWQNLVAIRRRRISIPRNRSDAPLAADKGHFVVYLEDGRRFVIPLVYLNNEVLIQLLKMSEEEFGLLGDGPITLPCDAFLMEYIISLICRGVAEDLEKALLINQEIMINPKKVIKMARKWQRLAALRRKRITLPGSSLSVADKGHFVAYTTDRKRYAFPMVYLNSYIFRELFKMSEEEFGLPSDGPITLPCDAEFMDYAISLLKKRTTQDIEKALLINQDIMINSKKLIKMARKWQRVAAIRRKRISLSGSSASVNDKGHFVVYSTDRKRYVFPLVYLSSYIFRELLKASEEEYGLPSDGPIVFPCDAVFMDYAVALIQKRTTQDVEKALFVSMANRCSSPYSLHQQETNQRLLVEEFYGPQRHAAP
ncbi:hypothetical protein RJ639_011936 [Escallonia herrerae]|uniref:Small auxin up regulated protein n=1 Tax=Escallonia herrerae TaxID=1293975 RepID=A0AA88VMR7_9ASTE|nr:hypothetical protein RJ639_011936 [Escallonia herrerae]